MYYNYNSNNFMKCLTPKPKAFMICQTLQPFDTYSGHSKESYKTHKLDIYIYKNNTNIKKHNRHLH